MKWVIVSDNYGMENILTDIKSIHDDADLLIHLGDSEFDYHAAELDSYLKIKGNCDVDPQFEEEIVLHHNGIDAYLTHGHHFSVGRGLKQLAARAADRHCKLALYGHTHIGAIDTVDGIVCINPGSIAQSRSDEAESYAVITFDETEKMITFYDQHHEITGKEVLLF